jgi:hypothetical protein
LSSGEVPDSPRASSKVIHPEKMLPAPSSRGGWKTSGDILKLCRSIPSYAASVMEYLGRFNPVKESRKPSYYFSFYLLLLDVGSNCARETNFCILMIHGIFWMRTGEQIIIMFLYSKIIYFRCIPGNHL